jgi:hypothetical protein
MVMLSIALASWVPTLFIEIFQIVVTAFPERVIKGVAGAG